MLPSESLATLKAGNERFLLDQRQYPHQSSHRRREVVTGQHPFAVILTCSDSRVPPEVIFDQGIGDLFVIRNAGNIVDDVVIGSIEYAVEHLHTPLVIVLGHQQCGAVTAALKGGKATGHIASVIEKILPAVADARKQPGDPLLNAIDANVARMVNELRASHPVLAEYYNE